MSSALINFFWWGLIAIVLFSFLFNGPTRTLSHVLGTGINITEKTSRLSWFFLTKVGFTAVVVSLFQHGLATSLLIPHRGAVAVVVSTMVFLGGAYLLARYFLKNPFRKATVKVAARALVIGFAVFLFYELNALYWTGREIALEDLPNAWPAIQDYLSRSITVFEWPHYYTVLIASAYREADGLLIGALIASTVLCVLVPYRMEEIPGREKSSERSEALARHKGLCHA